MQRHSRHRLDIPGGRGWGESDADNLTLVWLGPGGCETRVVVSRHTGGQAVEAVAQAYRDCADRHL